MTSLPPVMADILARVRLDAAKAGGRPLAGRPRCPALFGEQRRSAPDCMLLLDRVGITMEPGTISKDVPIRFAAIEQVLHALRLGARFALWDGRDIGEAEITAILPRHR